MLRSLYTKLVANWVAASTRVHFAMVSFATACAVAASAALPALAGATPTETEAKLEEISGKVNTEGIKILLIVLTGMVGLIVAVLIVPKAIKWVRKFI